MKKILMRTSLVLLLIFGMAATASAIPITGSIAFSGSGSTDSDANFTLATKFNKFSDVTIDDAKGSYSAVPAYPSLLMPTVTFNGFTFSPITVPVAPLWTFVYSGNTYSFDATSMAILYIDKDNIVIQGYGTARITGFDATNGEWNVRYTGFVQFLRIVGRRS
jgi:hypothetical protein